MGFLNKGGWGEGFGTDGWGMSGTNEFSTVIDPTADTLVAGELGAKATSEGAGVAGGLMNGVAGSLGSMGVGALGNKLGMTGAVGQGITGALGGAMVGGVPGAILGGIGGLLGGGGQEKKAADAMNQQAQSFLQSGMSARERSARGSLV